MRRMARQRSPVRISVQKGATNASRVSKVWLSSSPAGVMQSVALLLANAVPGTTTKDTVSAASRPAYIWRRLARVLLQAVRGGPTATDSMSARHEGQRGMGRDARGLACFGSAPLHFARSAAPYL